MNNVFADVKWVLSKLKMVIINCAFRIWRTKNKDLNHQMCYTVMTSSDTKFFKEQFK